MGHGGADGSTSKVGVCSGTRSVVGFGSGSGSVAGVGGLVCDILWPWNTESGHRDCEVNVLPDHQGEPTSNNASSWCSPLASTKGGGHRAHSKNILSESSLSRATNDISPVWVLCSFIAGQAWRCK